MALEQQRAGADGRDGRAEQPALVPQLTPTAGLPERQAAGRRMARVLSMLPRCRPRPRRQYSPACRLASTVSLATRRPKKPTTPMRPWKPTTTEETEVPEGSWETPEPGRLASHWPGGGRRDRPAHPVPGAGALRQTGRLFALGASVISLTFRRPFQVRELIEQFWFIASVTILPSMLVAIPFGAVITLQVGSLTSNSARSPSPARRACSRSSSRPAR